MRLNVTALSLSVDGEPATARRIVGNRGCNLWIGGIVLNGTAETFRELARAASEAAAIEDECDALKQQPHSFEAWPIADSLVGAGCRFCGGPKADPRHLVANTVGQHPDPDRR
jgi:hypothetical protein